MVPAHGSPLRPAATPVHSMGQQGDSVQVLVRDNNIEQALRVLKKKMQREGIFREMKARRAHEKPSERKTRQQAEAVRRAHKLARKRAQREGLLPPPAKRKAPLSRRPTPGLQQAAGSGGGFRTPFE
jgi:small subunit ribosomal protein S21